MSYNLQQLQESLKKLDELTKAAGSAELKHPNKLGGWALWDSWGRPQYTVAPMVDQSELPFRMMCRKYGSNLAYTPMFHAGLYAADPDYRRRKFSTCEGDKPLLVQFCGNDAATVLEAARHVEDHCDGVDLNLGCPQGIAKRGHYGSFLMEHWDTVFSIIRTLHVELKIPVTAKIRVFEDIETTVAYAKMVQAAGAQVIGVHGRTRDMKGPFTGVADWKMIKAVKDAITEVPVIANGNIECMQDVIACLTATGCDGVMSAEGLLWDPRLFADVPDLQMNGRRHQADRAGRLGGIRMALEYLDYATEYPTELASVRAHLWKLVHHSMEVHPPFRDRMNKLGAWNIEQVAEETNAAKHEIKAGDVENEETQTCVAEGAQDGTTKNAPRVVFDDADRPKYDTSHAFQFYGHNSKTRKEWVSYLQALQLLRNLLMELKHTEENCDMIGPYAKREKIVAKPTEDEQSGQELFDGAHLF